jgi:HSP20 family molecular chaperone IbpA
MRGFAHLEDNIMAEKTVPSSGGRLSKESTRTQDLHITPPVDIYESPEGLVVLADLPGVAREGLRIEVSNGILTIEGISRSELPGHRIYREFELASFFRQFELSDKVDQARISAVLKHGVLTLTLPRAEEAKPRKIEVKAG